MFWGTNLELAIEYAARNIMRAINGEPNCWLLAETWMRNAEFLMVNGANS